MKRIEGKYLLQIHGLTWFGDKWRRGCFVKNAFVPRDMGYIRRLIVVMVGGNAGQLCLCLDVGYLKRDVRGPF